MKLTKRERDFINAYFGKDPQGRPVPSFNGAAAMRAIGFTGKSPKRAASNIKKPHVKAEIARRKEELRIQRAQDPNNFTEYEIIEKLKAIASADLSMVLDPDGSIDTTKLHYLGQALKSFEIKKDYRSDGSTVITHKVKIVDVSKILIQLGKVYGMWKGKMSKGVDISSVGDAFKAQIGISQEALLQAGAALDVKLQARVEQYSGKESNG